MKKMYATIVMSEWELRGDVTPEMINERLLVSLRELMMTRGAEGESYALRDADELLVVRTIEVPSKKGGN